MCISRKVVGVPTAAIEKAVAERIGVKAEALGKSGKASIGFAGAADALLSLTQVLGRARPGERILVLGFGQGCDALLFEGLLRDQLPCIDREREFCQHDPVYLYDNYIANEVRDRKTRQGQS